jgi:DNA-binding GntR family transcriptional regulator
MRAAERAYLIARKGILHGQYAAGSRLTEHHLTQATGVSRTPVREALRRLHAEGFVQFEPNHGAVVAAQGPEDAEEIFELRALLEPISAGRAAMHAAPATVEQLRSLARQQLLVSTQRGPQQLTRIGDLNDRFHRLIQCAAESRRLAKTLAGLIEAPLILRTFGQYSSDELRRSANQHMELVEAIEAHDAPWAESVMRAHILAGRATYLRGLGRTA